MKNFEEFKDEKQGVKNYIMKFEEALKKVSIINFNETSIEFPNMIVFSKEEKTLLYSMLNPGVEVFKVSEEDFKEMLNTVKVKLEENINIKYIDRKVSPKTTARVNLDLLKEKAVYLREYNDTFICNEILFTTSETEFHGTGMFTGRNHVFLVSTEDFVEIKNYIKS